MNAPNHPVLWPGLSIEDSLDLQELQDRANRRGPSLPAPAGTWKAALALRVEIPNFIRVYGLDHCALLTLILESPRKGESISPEDAQTALRRAWRHLLPKHFSAYIAVLDFHRSGRIHFHVLVCCKCNIRQGWNFDVDAQHRAIQQAGREGRRRMTREEGSSARKLARSLTTSPTTKALWKDLRKSLPACGFRRGYPCELKPVRVPEGLALYLSRRYRDSRAAPRDLRPAHSQCVRYSRSYPRCVDKKLRFSPVGQSARRHRLKKAAVGAAFGIHDVGEMADVLGARWEHDMRDILQPVNPLAPDGFFEFQREKLAGRVGWTKLPIPPQLKSCSELMREEVLRSAERIQRLVLAPATVSPDAREQAGLCPVPLRPPEAESAAAIVFQVPNSEAGSSEPPEGGEDEPSPSFRRILRPVTSPPEGSPWRRERSELGAMEPAIRDRGGAAESDVSLPSQEQRPPSCTAQPISSPGTGTGAAEPNAPVRSHEPSE